MSIKTSYEHKALVIAEVLHKPEESTPMIMYLLGTDGVLYKPHDYNSYVKPFDTELNSKGCVSDESEIERILNESLVEYEDGSVLYGDDFCHSGGFK